MMRTRDGVEAARAGPRARVADLAADQKAGQPVGDVARRELAHQAPACARRRCRAQDSPSPRPRAHAARERVARDRRPPRCRPGGRGCCARAATSNISPVMNVMKSTMRPALDARPLAVRAGQHGQHALVARPTAPSICVSSPRMTSGMPFASRVDDAGNDRERARRYAHEPARQRGERRGTRDVRRLDPALPAADHAARDARRAVVAPVAEQRRERVARSGRPATCVMPSGALREPSTSPSRSMQIGARRGRAPVDRDERRAAHRWNSPECPESGPARTLRSRFAAGQVVRPVAARRRSTRAAQRRRYQRAAASSSLARASTQRAPSGVCSFFQNGARVLR